MPSSAPPRDAVSVIAQEFLVDDPCALSVHVPGAHTRLRPGSDPERVEIDISVTGCPPDEAEEILDRMQVGTRQMKDTVHVYSDSDRSDAEWWRWVRTLDVELHVDLRLPRHVEAEIRAPGGAVDIADLEGHIDVSVMGGPCQATNLGGTLDIRAESSDVSIDDFRGNEVIARVAVGSLTLTDVEADTLTVRAVAGPLSLHTITGAATVTAKSAAVEMEDVSGPCTAQVQAGRLTFRGAPSEEVTLRGIGSSLDVAVPADHGADLRMRGPAPTLADGLSFEGERTDQTIDGTLAGGGPALALEAVGDGAVRCRPS